MLSSGAPAVWTIGEEPILELGSIDGEDPTHGNPRMDNVATIFDVLREALKVDIEVHAVEAA